MFTSYYFDELKLGSFEAKVNRDSVPISPGQNNSKALRRQRIKTYKNFGVSF